MVKQAMTSVDVGARPTPRSSFEFEWNRPLGLPECPYVYRWVFGLKHFSIRIHHWLSSDDERNFHDHPWWFVTFILKGGYTDISPAGEERLSRGMWRYRPALHRHTVRIDRGEVWTLLVTGPEFRHWGFWVGRKFIRYGRYFRKHGHHPCAK